ncbi:MAG: HAD family hydrolase [Alphaproteobacteria bacterium]
MIQKPTAILFDWDNTLADNWPVINAAMNAALQKFNRPPLSMDESIRYARMPHEQSFPTLFGDDWPKGKALFYENFQAQHLEHIKLLPGARELLTWLQSKNIYLAIVSNKNGAFLRKEVEFLGLSPYFAAIIGAGDAASDKPDKVAMLAALSGLSTWNDQDCRLDYWPDYLMVGDTDVDLRAGKNMGFVSVLITNSPITSNDYSDCPPQFILADLYGLKDLLQPFFLD